MGRFQPMLSFGLLRAHLFLGSFPAFGYLRPVTVIFCLWAKFSPSLQSARLWTVNLLGHFHSITKYGLLTARYGQPIKRTISTLARLRPIKGPYKTHKWVGGPWILRDVEGPWILRDVEGPWIRRPVKGHGRASWPPFERYSIFKELSYSILSPLKSIHYTTKRSRHRKVE